jgi:glycine oxidase
VLCGGSWSARLGKLQVAPQKGQLLLLDEPAPAQVIFGGGGYAVPRGDQTLVGATSEDAGFDSTPTAEGQEQLLNIAAALGCETRKVIDHWAGLRPVTPDGLPILGQLAKDTFVATGHYRNGVLLTPMTARVVAALVLGETPPVDLLPFAPSRR